MHDIDRIYEILRIQGETLARISQSQEDTRERLFGGAGQPGAIPYLHAEVSKHSKQLTFYRGVLAAVSFLLTTAVAWAGVVISKHVK